MKIETLDRQSLLDIAIQTSGSVEAVFDLSRINDISVSATLTSGTVIKTAAVVDKLVLARIEAQNIRPATGLDSEPSTDGIGVGYMTIGIDFIIH